MEGINLEKRTPAVENEIGSLTRGEKIERAEKSVRSMFDINMEVGGVIRRVVEDNKSSFSDSEERF
jgi:hypothetical protein